MTCSRRDHLRMIRAQQRRSRRAMALIDHVSMIESDSFVVSTAIVIACERAEPIMEELRRREEAYHKFCKARHAAGRSYLGLPNPRKWKRWEKRYVKQKRAEAVARGEKPMTYRVCQ